MPLNVIKKVSELVPETAPMIKRASLEQNLPTNNRDETLISALELEYMIKVAHTHVDIEDATRVCQAVDLYELKDEVNSKVKGMLKAASIKNDTAGDVNSAVNMIQNQLLSMSPNIEKVANASEELWDGFVEYISDDQIKLYAGAGTLVKEAAVAALNHRTARTGNTEFQKIASVISSTDVDKLDVEDNRAIIHAIRGLEKEAQYAETDLYTDMFITKEAAISVDLGGKSVDAADLIKVSGQAGDILGQDIGSLLSDAANNKAAIEALPLGEKNAIKGIV